MLNYKLKTGLADANGCEIKEGDILESHTTHTYDEGTKDEHVSHSFDIAIVAYRHGQFGLLRHFWKQGGNMLYFKDGDFSKDLHGWLQSKKFYITGNIHDN